MVVEWVEGKWWPEGLDLLILIPGDCRKKAAKMRGLDYAAKRQEDAMPAKTPCALKKKKKIPSNCG